MTNRDDNVEKVVDAVEAVEAAEQVNGRETVTLSTGVELKVRPVPRHFIYEVTRRFVRPTAPMIDMGKGRLEENPGDPDYAAALESYIADIANAATDTAFVLGSEIEEIPDGFPGPDSEDFLEKMEVLGVTDLKRKTARYLYWVKAFAAPTSEDINTLLGEIGRLTGVAESDVEDAVKRFRSLAPRGEDRPPSDE